MSLINKMLQDLESRKNPQAEATEKKSVYEDLKPLSRIASSRAPSRRLIVLLVAVVAVAAGAYGWTQWGDTLVASLFPEEPVAPAPVVARKAAPPKPAPVSAPAPAPAPAPVAVPVQAAEIKTVPAPVATEKAPEAPVQVAQAKVVPPALVEEKKPVVTPVPNTVKKGTLEKPKAATESGYWTVSHGETLYGISAKTGIDLWDLSSWNKLGREHVIRPGQRLRLTPPATGSTTAGARPATDKKDSPLEKPKTTTASVASPDTKKSGPKMGPAVSASAGEIHTVDTVMDKKVKPLSSSEKAESEYRRAADLLQKGRMADAEKLLKSAINIDETYTPARELLVGIMLQQGHWREAHQILEEGIDKVPAHYPFAQLLARVYVEHGADQKALAVMEAGRGAAAKNPEYVAFLAALYQRSGKHAEAVKAYSEAVTLNPREGRSWLGMGISLEATQDWDNAEKAYQRAIEGGTLDDNLLKYARQRLAVVKNK